MDKRILKKGMRLYDKGKHEDAAKYLLAVCYEHGYGAVKSIYHAIDYYRMAADQGHKEAKEALERLKKEEKI